MKILLILAGATSFLIAAPSAFAQAVEEKHIVSGKATLDAESGYIFMSGTMRTYAMFLKLPDAADTAAYEKQWSEELAKVQKKYPGKLRTWEENLTAPRELKRRPTEKPVEPTPENFSIGPIEMLNPVSVGPQYVFAKSEDPDRYSYLTKVKPGTYVYYGPIMVAAAAAGSCYCMGTVQFEVKPGVVTDLGNFLIAAPQPDPAFPRTGLEYSGSTAGLYNLYVDGPPTPMAVEYGVPATLNALPHVTADFRAAPKLGNFLGLPVSRMPPVPGVLAYDRDRVIDVKAETSTADTTTAMSVSEPAAAH